MNQWKIIRFSIEWFGANVLSPLFLILAIWINLISKGPYSIVKWGWDATTRFRIFNSVHACRSRQRVFVILGDMIRASHVQATLSQIQVRWVTQLINVFIGRYEFGWTSTRGASLCGLWTPWAETRAWCCAPALRPASISSQRDDWWASSRPEKYHIEYHARKLKLYLSM